MLQHLFAFAGVFIISFGLLQQSSYLFFVSLIVAVKEMYISVACDICIGVRAGGGDGAAAPPPKFWATQIFWAERENLGKACF